MRLPAVGHCITRLSVGASNASAFCTALQVSRLGTANIWPRRTQGCSEGRLETAVGLLDRLAAHGRLQAFWTEEVADPQMLRDRCMLFPLHKLQACCVIALVSSEHFGCCQVLQNDLRIPL